MNDCILDINAGAESRQLRGIAHEEGAPNNNRKRLGMRSTSFLDSALSRAVLPLRLSFESIVLLSYFFSKPALCHVDLLSFHEYNTCSYHIAACQ